MSLRTVFAMLEDAVPAASRSGAGGTGLFFVLNSGFLRPFHVLVYSLARNGSLLDLPVVVISEDAKLADDPVVAAVADRFVLAGAQEIAQFAGISDRKVEEGLRLGWIAKYTFLKWLVFADHGFRRHVYLDADMLCLNPCDGLAELADADLYAAPVFDKKLTRDPQGWMRPLGERERRVAHFLESGNRTSLNSGVMVANHRLLDGTFRRRLIALAESEPVPVEQLVIRRLLRDGADYTFGPLPPLFNFNHGFLAAMGVPRQLRLLGAMKLLHFVGGGLKPWSVRGPAAEESAWISDTLWRRTADEACQALTLFAEARDRLDRAEPTVERP